LAKEAKIPGELCEDILTSIEGGIFSTDLNARITSFNRSAEEITGYKEAEVLGKECCQVLNSELCEKNCPIKEVLAKERPVFNYEVSITKKAGEKVPVNMTVSPLRSRDNKLIGIVENFRDLTKHKGLWGKLRQERNRAQQYLNIAGVIIVAIQSNGIVSLINKKGCAVLGYKEETIIGKNWFAPHKARAELYPEEVLSY